MITTLICGTFDDNGGRPSGYMSKLLSESNASHYINGGYWNTLSERFIEIVSISDVLCWFPDIPNDKAKLVGEIKKINSRCILVTSKNNRSGKYTHHDIVARALNTRSNLLLELKDRDGLIVGTVHDPLGNVFLEDSPNPNAVWKAIEKRTRQLKEFARTPSVQVGSALEVPNENEFFEIVKAYADKFHDLIHAVNSNRLLGNASFRCERGFPSFKYSDKIFVSRRNVDKRFISREGFVAVDVLDKNAILEVKYYGEAKPSVDTPVQLKLFDYYKNIKYMLHAHTYIKNAPFTHSVVPCGALEEFAEIVSLAPKSDTCNFYVNLKGHGSLVLAKDIGYLKDIPYISRPAPERWLEEAK